MTVQPDTTTPLFITGITIILVFLVPMLMIYWINSIINPKKRTTPPPPPLDYAVLHRFRPKTRRLCFSHKIELLNKGVCLIVKEDKCDYCSKLKRG